MNAISLVSSGIDSPVASYMVSQYVDTMTLLHVDTGQFSTGEHNTTFLSLAQHLKGILPCRIQIGFVPHGASLQAFKTHANSKFTCLFCKRMMLRYANYVAQQQNAEFIVMGDSLGQVASQTLYNIKVIDVVSKIPILRPLIGFDKQDIIRIAKEIGTYDLSIADKGICLAVPKKPSTKALVTHLDDLEKTIDIDALFTDAVSHIIWKEL